MSNLEQNYIRVGAWYVYFCTIDPTYQLFAENSRDRRSCQCEWPRFSESVTRVSGLRFCQITEHIVFSLLRADTGRFREVNSPKSHGNLPLGDCHDPSLI
jgi:hypothetical protein